MISSFYPVVPGRTSDSLGRNRALYQVQADQIDLQRLQIQLATGYRFQKLSEAPTEAIRVLGLQREQEFKQQTLVNLKSAQSYLNTSEASLNDAQGILNAVKGLSLEAANNVLSDSDRQGLLSQIDSYLSRLVAIGNQRSRDRFLFTGGEVAQVPIELRSQTTRFHGDDLDLLSIGDQRDYLVHNVTSQRAFGVISEGVTGSVDLNPAIDRSTRLMDLNGGVGVGAGALELSDGSSVFTIDLANAETLGDVVDGINQATLSGRSVTATLDANGLNIQYSDGLPGTLRISDLGAGRVAKNLGIATTAPLPSLPIQGADLNPIVRPTTRIADLMGGAGIAVAPGFKIIQGEQAYTVDLSAAVTVEDLLNAVHTSGAAVIADINPDGRGLRIRSVESGTDFSITETTGTLASQLGLRTFHSQTRLDDLRYGQGLERVDGPDLYFTRSDGTEFSVDLDGAVTVQDVLDRINNHLDNQDPNLRITASLQPFANGINLRAAVPASPSTPPVPIAVRSAGGSSAAYGLGLVDRGASEKGASLSGSFYVLNGTDPNPQETNGIFNSLLRLRNAVQKQDLGEVGRASELIDSDLERLSLARSDLGIRQQRLEGLHASNEDQLVELKSQESDARDVDLAGVISELNARQAAYEANLQLLAQITRTTIFNFI